MASRSQSHIRKSIAQQAIDQIVSGWANAPKIIVFDGIDDPLVPRQVKIARSKKGDQPSAEPSGIFLDDQVFINARKMHSPVDLSSTVFHESLGHYGLRGTYGDSLDSVLREVARLRPKDVASKVIEYRLSDDESGRLEAAEEILADIAQTSPSLTVVQTAVANIRTWFRKNIPALEDMELSREEIIRDYIVPAREFVINGGSAQRRRQFHKSSPDVQAFCRDSHVIDQEGMPRMVYRGEHGKNPTGGIHSRLASITFTEDLEVASVYAKDPNNSQDIAEDSRVIKAFLSIKNPIFKGVDDPFLEVSWLEEKLGRDEAVRIAKKFEEWIAYTGNWEEDPDGIFAGFASPSEFIDAHPDQLGKLYFDAYPYLDDAEEVRLLMDLGYDGAIHMGNGESSHTIEYRVFSPSQILIAETDRDCLRYRDISTAFDKWFGRSKIVDKSGAPLILYHGTTADITEFQQNKATQKDAGWYGRGIYFTADPITASAYSGYEGIQGKELSGAPRVMPVYASIQNPYFWPKGRQAATSTEEAQSIRDELEAAGYDGVVVPNEFAAPEFSSHYEVVAFFPNQIKSMTGNNGEFDSDNPDIRYRVVADADSEEQMQPRG